MTLIVGDSMLLMRTALPENSVDAIVTDPPYGLSFMGKDWDATDKTSKRTTIPPVVRSMRWHERWAKEALRVLKPGGHLLACVGSRTYHSMAMGIELAGFEVRDQVMWVYGSGFPKSMNVGKAIDKRRVEDHSYIRAVCRFIRAGMDAKGLKSRDMTKFFGGCNPRLIDHWAARDTDSQPNLPTNEQYSKLKSVLGLSDVMDGEVRRLNARKSEFGDAFKSRKVTGTVESWEDRTNYAMTSRDGLRRDAPATESAKRWEGWGTALKPAHEPLVLAQKPFPGTVAENVMRHGTGAINIDGCRVGEEGGVRKVNPDKSGAGHQGKSFGCNGETEPVGGRWPANFIHDGSPEVLELLPENARRFFYVAKPSKSEKNAGLGDEFEEKQTIGGGGTSNKEAAEKYGSIKAPAKNFHPTVKPVSLMRYLCRLVTPPGGTVLDPFTGSGTTGVAAKLEGFEFIGIEKSPEYAEIAKARIKAAKA